MGRRDWFWEATGGKGQTYRIPENSKKPAPVTASLYLTFPSEDDSVVPAGKREE